MKFPKPFQDTPPEILNHGLVQHLFGVIESQSKEIEVLKKEIKILKGHSPKPEIPPNSNLEGMKSDPLRRGKKKLFYKKGQET